MNSWMTFTSTPAQAAGFTAVLLDALLKSLLVLTLAAGICTLWRRSAAATRHLIWFLAVACLPCLPWLGSTLPSWQQPLWSVSTAGEAGNQVALGLELMPGNGSGAGQPERPAATAGMGTLTPNNASPDPAHRLTAHVSARWLELGLAGWATGAALVLLFVVGGQLRLRHYARRAAGRPSADWAADLAGACATLGLRRPVNLLHSPDNVMPVTWGWWQPVVLLPAAAKNWSPERRRIVLLHELAHIKRWDCLTQLAAALVCALYWFNPLVWLAARQMRVEREAACDDLVLNGGCRASDYAGHLVEIAQSFRHVPQVAAIAMARPSGLEQRVAAIVDASRPRRLRPVTLVAILLATGGILFSVSGGQTSHVRSQADTASRLREQQLARLKEFSALKEKQSATLAAAAGESFSPEYQRFFAAATAGDWQTVTNQYESFKRRHPQYGKPHQHSDLGLRTSYWGPVLEICLAYDQVVRCEPEYTQMAVADIINSIPRGSIYFGGTDPGRGLPTTFSRSQPDADPFYTLTQNALADGTYLAYLRATYGEQKALLGPIARARQADSQLQALDARWAAAVQRLDTLEIEDPQYPAVQQETADLEAKRSEGLAAIQATLQAHAKANRAASPAANQTLYIPTAEDSQRCFQDYVADAQQRSQNHQLKAGEDFKAEANGRIQVGGQVAVMEINGRLVKLIFDKNPGREFYLEESFPLDWMYPYLEPHGLIFKINRQPLATLPGTVLAADRDFWRPRVAKMVGGWLDEDTPVKDVAAFADKVFRQHDLAGFSGDPHFVQNDYASRMFSKLRTSIAGLYAWRLEHAADATEKEGLVKAADLAFRQGFALCPYSGEAVHRYVNFLVAQKRTNDALLIAEAGAKITEARGEDSGQLRQLAGNIKGMSADKPVSN